MSNKNLLNLIQRFIKTASIRFKVEPHKVNTAQFWLIASELIPEWQVRKRGGFVNIRNILFPKPASKEKSVVYKLLGIK